MSTGCVCCSVESSLAAKPKMYIPGCVECTIICVFRSNAYTNVIFDEKDLSMDSEKGKMLMESN